ncbi:hypothetical protein TNCV_2986951 [Trichonephila clavipes]|nr:hypothetical protein TNCV_2986951 [Trichonephila clavipes]
MPNGCTSRTRQLSSAGSVRVSESLALETTQRIRHHLELQDRRDYTPADRAARTCWLGCPGAPVPILAA